MELPIWYGYWGNVRECIYLQELSFTENLEEMRNETYVWVLGLYKLSWPANGSFVYVILLLLLLLLLFCKFLIN